MKPFIKCTECHLLNEVEWMSFGERIVAILLHLS